MTVKEDVIETLNVYERLSCVQAQLNAPKNQFNKFGNYYYRSCEDIFEAVKPLLKQFLCTLNVSDEVVEIGGRVYVKATATFRTNKGEEISNTSFAREQLDVKGQVEAQITGATSSYARKYALNGLFLIDDVKDADATNEHEKENPILKDLKPNQIAWMLDHTEIFGIKKKSELTKEDVEKFKAMMKEKQENGK